MLLFGGCGVLQNVQKINIPGALNEMSLEFEDIEDEISKELGRANEDLASEEDNNDSLSTEVIRDYEPLSSEDSACLLYTSDAADE